MNALENKWQLVSWKLSTNIFFKISETSGKIDSHTCCHHRITQESSMFHKLVPSSMVVIHQECSKNRRLEFSKKLILLTSCSLFSRNVFRFFLFHCVSKKKKSPIQTTQEITLTCMMILSNLSIKNLNESKTSSNLNIT